MCVCVCTVPWWWLLLLPRMRGGCDQPEKCGLCSKACYVGHSEGGLGVLAQDIRPLYNMLVHNAPAMAGIYIYIYCYNAYHGKRDPTMVFVRDGHLTIDDNYCHGMMNVKLVHRDRSRPEIDGVKLLTGFI